MTTYEPFSGTERLAASPDAVYAFVTNLDELVKIVPGLVSSERVGDSAIKCSVRPGFSFIRTTLKQTFTIVERVPGKRIVMQVDASGIGTAFTVKAEMDLSPAEGGACDLKWTATIQKMTGLVAAVGTTIIRAAADQVIKQGFDGMRKAVEKRA